MKTKYERKPVRDGCWQTHKGWKPLYPNETGSMQMCRATLYPKPAGFEGWAAHYKCSNPECGHRYTDEEAKIALSAARGRSYRKREWNKIGTAINKAKFTKTGDADHDRRVDERIAMNSQVTINGTPLMMDTQTGWEAAIKAAFRVAMASTPAPTNMKEE
jgi:hypothetical protein